MSNPSFMHKDSLSTIMAIKYSVTANHQKYFAIEATCSKPAVIISSARSLY